MGLMERAAQQGGNAEKIIQRQVVNPAELRESLSKIESKAALLRIEAKVIRAQAKYYAKAAWYCNEIARYLNSKAAMYELGHEAPTAESKAHEMMARLHEHMAKGYGNEAD